MVKGKGIPTLPPAATVGCCGMDSADVCCPTCGEWFSVAVPPPDEQPCELDYDCEICCRPLVLRFEHHTATAHGIGD